eukprot:m.491493 g.491493  ORF g.491493 m.491493 type:complete len:316 (+) comp30124_c0_seq1:62-1009(+)
MLAQLAQSSLRIGRMPRVSYHDTVVSKQEFGLLDPPCWFSDSLVAFGFEHLSHCVFADACDVEPDSDQGTDRLGTQRRVEQTGQTEQSVGCSDAAVGGGVSDAAAAATTSASGCSAGQHLSDKSTAARVLFVDPSTAQMVALVAGEPLGELLGPLALDKRDVVCVALSDSDDAERAWSGSHWTLLAFLRDTVAARVCPSDPGGCRFLHFDSATGGGTGSVSTKARKVAAALAPLLVPTKCFQGPTFLNAQTPQQRNGFDCGAYVLCVAEHVCKMALGRDRRSLLEAIPPAGPTLKRKQLKEFGLLVSLRAATGAD